MAQKHIDEVLTTAGLTADQVKALVELKEDAADFKADAYTAPIRTAAETQVKNDPEFYKTINKENLPKDFLKTLESEQYGRAANIVRTQVLKAAGLAEKDFADLGEDGKKIEVFTPAFMKKVSEGKVTDRELQQKLADAQTEIEALQAKEPEIEKKHQTAAEQRIADFVFENKIVESIAEVKNLKVPPGYISSKVIDAVKEKFDFKVVGKTVELLQKGKDLLAMEDNKPLKLAKAISDIITKELPEAVEKVRGTGSNSGKTGTVTGDKGELKISSHVHDKIQKRLEQDEKSNA